MSLPRSLLLSYYRFTVVLVYNQFTLFQTLSSVVMYGKGGNIDKDMQFRKR